MSQTNGSSNPFSCNKWHYNNHKNRAVLEKASDDDDDKEHYPRCQQTTSTTYSRRFRWDVLDGCWCRRWDSCDRLFAKLQCVFEARGVAHCQPNRNGTVSGKDGQATSSKRNGMMKRHSAASWSRARDFYCTVAFKIKYFRLKLAEWWYVVLKWAPYNKTNRTQTDTLTVWRNWQGKDF